MARLGGRTIRYPTNHVLGIVDRPADAEAVVAELTAAGFPEGDVTLLAGEVAAQRIDGLGRRHGLMTRILRVVQFMTMDQTPDFALYEGAIRDGRTVVAAYSPTRDRMLRARDILGTHGGYFLNFYGRVNTEELDRNRDATPPRADPD